jgi:acyl carrier protein
VFGTVQIPVEFEETLRQHLPYADAGELAADDELTALGLESMSIMQLLAGLEDLYDIEIPDEILNEETFATVGSLWGAMSSLVPDE